MSQSERMYKETSVRCPKATDAMCGREKRKILFISRSIRSIQSFYRFAAAFLDRRRRAHGAGVTSMRRRLPPSFISEVCCVVRRAIVQASADSAVI